MGHQDFFKLKKTTIRTLHNSGLVNCYKENSKGTLVGGGGVGGVFFFFFFGKVRNNLSLGSLKSVLLLFLELNLIIELQL
jgi:hypothetical protein